MEGRACSGVERIALSFAIAMFITLAILIASFITGTLMIPVARTPHPPPKTTYGHCCCYDCQGFSKYIQESCRRRRVQPERIRRCGQKFEFT